MVTMPAGRSAQHVLLAALVAVFASIPGVAPAQIAGADLAVHKSDLPDPAAIGLPLTYTVTVENLGPGTATGVLLEDVLPLGVSFTSATPSQGSCSQLLLIVTCSLGALADQAMASVAIVVTPSGSGTLNNIAAAESQTLDPNPLNNLVTEATTVGSGAGQGTDLAVEKADAPDPVTPGHNLTYVITVANVGGSGASNVVLVDLLPVDVAMASVSASQGSCRGLTLVLIQCNLGNIAGGDSVTVTLVVRSGPESTIANIATVASETLETNLANNLSIARTTINTSSGGGGGGGGGSGGGGGGGGVGGQGRAGCTIMGTSLDDNLVGTQGDDVICGLAGKDTMKGMGGKDRILGGKGNDRANGGRGNDALMGHAGRDKLRGAQKSDRLSGGAKNDRLNGGPGRDRLRGGKGKDRCKRGKGDRVGGCP
jgi:uncharacterized repeat protein (TIGR01451 family)